MTEHPYTRLARSYWDKEYKAHDWTVTHNAGDKQKTTDLAEREMSLFLSPTPEKVKALLEYEHNPYPTFTPDFAKHPSYQIQENQTALDYGCGSLARYSKALSRRFSSVIGLDVSEEAISKARSELNSTEQEKISLRTCDGFSLDLASESVDFIFSNLVLQHIGSLPVLRSLASEFIRVLKPGGMMRLEYLDGSQRKPEQFFSVVEGTGMKKSDLYSMFKGAKLECITEQHPWLWVTVTKENQHA
ncbi:MAG: class I SAM-dependent methyltransferase [Pontimonas sp.]